MDDLQKYTRFFQGDAFAMQSSITIEQVREGSCVCRMPILPMHQNARGVVMGGAIFTLCDFTFAVAANSLGNIAVTQNADIAFLKPAAGTFLVARAKMIARTKRTCHYEVNVENDQGVLVAHMVVNGHISSEENGLK